MLRFSRPGDLAQSLKESYEYLRPGIERLAGYPVRIVTRDLQPDPPGTSFVNSDGEWLVRLPSPGARLDGNTFLLLSGEAQADAVAKQIVGKLYGLARRVASSVKRSWDLKALMVREEPFLWDNLVASLNFRGNAKYNALELLGVVRNTLLIRYEGRPVEIGVLASWNWHTLEPELRELGCKIQTFRRSFDLRARLRSNMKTHLLADAKSSLFIARSNGEIGHLVYFPQSAGLEAPDEWQLVPSPYAYLSKVLRGRDIAFATTYHGELYYFTSGVVLKWLPTGWHRVSGTPLAHTLLPHVDPDPAKAIAGAVAACSRRRIGALFVLTSRPDALLDEGTPGMAGAFRTTPLFSVCQVSVDALTRLASIDGAVIIDPHGNVLDAGVLLEVPQAFAAAGEGARAAAATYASTFGLAIKVSHDGPVTVYRDGTVVRRAA